MTLTLFLCLPALIGFSLSPGTVFLFLLLFRFSFLFPPPHILPRAHVSSLSKYDYGPSIQHEAASGWIGMSQTHEMVAKAVIAWVAALVLVTLAWVEGAVSGAFYLNFLALVALIVPFGALGLGLFASLHEKRVAVWFAGHRRILVGVAALVLIAAPTYLVVAHGGAKAQEAFLLGLFVMSVLALSSIGVGLMELLGFDPLGLSSLLSRRLIVRKFITALNDRDKSAAMALVRPVPLKRHPAGEARVRIEQSIDDAIRGRPNLSAGPVGTGDRVQIRGDIGGVSLSEDAHLELTEVGDDDHCISSVEL
jgi:hypothetical protein